MSDLDELDVVLDVQQLSLLRAIRKSIATGVHDIMTTMDDLNTAVAQTGKDAQAAADRVVAAIAAATAAASSQIADLQAQVQALLSGNAGNVTSAQLQAVADGLAAVDTTVKGIAPDAVGGTTVGPSYQTKFAVSPGKTTYVPSPLNPANATYTATTSGVPYVAPTTNLVGTGPHDEPVVVVVPTIPVGGPAYKDLKPADQSTERPADPPINKYPPTVVP